MKLLKISLFALCILGCKGNSASDTNTNTASQPTVSSNNTVGTYPHKVDIYSAENPQYGVIFLHGGGGKKEGLAYDLGFKSDTAESSYNLTTTGAQWLNDQKVMAVFPQGQTLPSYNAWTWNNYVMDSGVDDVAFLNALVAWLKTLPLSSHVTKYYLVGHSNGGMMVNRTWCESPGNFSGFGSLAGPASIHLHPSTGQQPCQPSQVRPYIGIVGNKDRVLMTTNHMSDPTWEINSLMRIGNPPTWIDNPPTLINEKNFHTIRANLKCGATVQTPTTDSNITTYSDCSDTLRLLIVEQTTVNGAISGGDHCLVRLSGTCATTLSGATGLDYRQIIFGFLKER